MISINDMCGGYVGPTCASTHITEYGLNLLERVHSPDDLLDASPSSVTNFRRIPGKRDQPNTAVYPESFHPPKRAKSTEDYTAAKDGTTTTNGVPLGVGGEPRVFPMPMPMPMNYMYNQPVAGVGRALEVITLAQEMAKRQIFDSTGKYLVR
jgi:hypothetical protein